jgi:hypothetical protein
VIVVYANSYARTVGAGFNLKIDRDFDDYDHGAAVTRCAVATASDEPLESRCVMSRLEERA